MATTTNFGWETPDDTDLVKDGALAMRTLGNAIDASLVDLKGGTTGQVLSKTSNTDMDFTWVTSDDANAIQNAIVDAKGDLIAASAADTPARLAVGSNGDTLVADSAATTGLRWQETNAAGKNLAINGAADFWQRGTTFTNTVGYTADRWYQGANNVTTTQESTTVPSGFRYAIKGTATASTQPYYMQAFETSDVVKYAGKKVVLSYWVATSDSSNALLRIDTSTSVDVSVQGSFTTVDSISRAASSTFTRISATFDIPSTAKSLRILVGAAGNIANGQSVTFTGVQLEIGSVPTAFTRSAGTLQGETALCQRYYYRHIVGQGEPLGAAWYFNSTTAVTLVQFPVTMRTTASLVASSGTDFYSFERNGGYDAFNSFILGNVNNKMANIYNASEVSGTAGQAGYMFSNNASSSLAFSAEL